MPAVLGRAPGRPAWRGVDIRSFHDRVLEDGAVPLVMLRAKIERRVQQTENAAR